MMMIVSLLTVLSGLGYSGWRISSMMPLSSAWRWFIAIAWVLLFLSLIAGLFLMQRLPLEFARVIYVMATSAVFYLLYVVMTCLVLDLARCFPVLRTYLAPSWTLVLCVWIWIIGAFTYGSLKYHHKVRVPLDLKLAHALPKPIKIVGLSDLHLGYTIRRGELEKWVEMINAEQPDLILIAGDIVDGDTRPVLAEHMYEVINQLNAPVYACLGNHEYIGGEAQQRSFLEKTKVTLLRDSVALFDNSLYIIGRDDATNRQRKPLHELTKGLDRSKPILLLDHQPHSLEQAQEAGIDFQFSGHTHRGQVFPVNLIVDQLYEQSHGYLQKGQTHYYVSSGIGIWGGKYRIGTQSEYLVMTLR